MLFALGVALLRPPVDASAAEAAAPAAIQSLEAIASKAEATVRDAMPQAASDASRAGASRIVARTPDPRLRLARCAGELVGTLPGGSSVWRGRGIAQVSCAGPVRWNVLVPVTIETEVEALVARRNLPRGAVPQAGDLESRQLVVQGISDNYVTSLKQVEGMQLSRPLLAGAPLTRELLTAGPVVRRGESVTLVSHLGGLQVRAPGLALQDARPGERVRVQNVNSLKVVEGRADKEGMIQVDR